MHKQKTVRLLTLMYIALRNLRYRLLRTSLTVTGVVIGIGSVVLLLSLGLGLQRLVTQQVVGTKSIKTIDVTSQNAQILSLNDSAATKIAQYPNVVNTSKVYSYASHISMASANTDAVVYGISSDYINLVSLQSVTNKALSFSGANDALINTSLLQALGITNPSKIIGQTLSTTVLPTAGGVGLSQGITKKTFTITGVVTADAGSALYVHDDVFVHAGATSFGLLKVVVNKDTDVPTVRKLIDGLGYSTASPYDTLTQITQLFTYFDFILLGFGGIGMVIAVLGMFNTLTISLLEHTKEVALMITLGARKRDVRELFLAEAVALAGAGGAIGILFAGALGIGINTLLGLYAHSRGIHDDIVLFYLPPWLAMVTLVFSVLIGLIVAIYPVIKAGKIDPVDILRRG